MATSHCPLRQARPKESAVRIRGLEPYVTPEHGPGAAGLVRAWADDLFR